MGFAHGTWMKSWEEAVALGPIDSKEEFGDFATLCEKLGARSLLSFLCSLQASNQHSSVFIPLKLLLNVSP